MRHRIQPAATFVVATMLFALTGAPSAAAEEAAGVVASGPHTETHTVLRERLGTDGKAYPVLRLDGLRLHKGRPKLFYAMYTGAKAFGEAVGKDARVDMLQSAWITCSAGEPTSTQAYPSRSAMTTRNHEGGAGVKRAVSVLWLFKPPADGTYSCVLWGLGGGMIKSPERWMNIVEDPAATVLRMANQDEAGAAEWYQGKDAYLCNTPSQAAGCGGRTATVLRAQWTADPKARSIDAFHGTQFSSSSGGMDPFVVETTLVVMQINKDGKACTTVRTAKDRISIPGVIHHLKVNRRIDNVPVQVGNGCTRTFVVKVEARYVRTHTTGTPNRPGLVHGPVGAAPLRPYSTAIAMNNF
ncbi:hypothetical protein ACTWPT_32125 [Nonomuraea sp. 3N208]|uniref:hypothetical protein n=1 Tax=Nonomuraea sp. 3N208 TaxID=3457421 RepID=UPI003FD5CE6A